jgi:cystathionine beta-lyase/cystathionine gamma-synthase
MRGGSGIVTAVFNLSAEETAKRISHMAFFTLAESLGGIESLVCHPASMTHASMPKDEREKVGIFDGLVRFSLGIEHIDDLIGDYERAFG